MKALLRKIRLPWIISIGSAAFGLLILAIFMPYGGESAIEGPSFTLGYLGLPMTILASLVLALVPLSWGHDELIVPLVGSFFYFTQWQLIAWLLHRWLTRGHDTITPTA